LWRPDLRDNEYGISLTKGIRIMRNIIIAIALTATFSLTPTLANNEASKAAAPVAAAPAAPDPDQEVKCRKIEVTGSIVRKGKVCKTVAEWKRIDNNGNRVARAIVASGNTCSGGELCRGN
jgi:hypothetical protein